MSEIEDVPEAGLSRILRSMGDSEVHGWRRRLQDAIDASGRSMRNISLGADLNPGYLYSILRDGKDPTVDSLIRIAQELGRPLVTFFQEPDTVQERQHLTRMLHTLTPEQLRFLQTVAAGLAAQGTRKPDGSPDESGTP
jgi:transcriptional regulator with XRE-family HTH domain